jgi:hypothetical protein
VCFGSGQVGGGADQSEMDEALWEIAEQLASVGFLSSANRPREFAAPSTGWNWAYAASNSRHKCEHIGRQNVHGMKGPSRPDNPSGVR